MMAGKPKGYYDYILINGVNKKLVPPFPFVGVALLQKNSCDWYDICMDLGTPTFSLHHQEKMISGGIFQQTPTE
jgi:hypothetical protein